MHRAIVKEICSRVSRERHSFAVSCLETRKLEQLDTEEVRGSLGIARFFVPDYPAAHEAGVHHPRTGLNRKGARTGGVVACIELISVRINVWTLNREIHLPTISIIIQTVLSRI